MTKLAFPRLLVTVNSGHRWLEVLIISAVCGRAPPENELPAAQPFLFPPPPPLPRDSQDWLSVTKTRTLPSLGSLTVGALAVGTVSNMAATTFEETPDFFNSSRSESESWKSQTECLIRGMIMS